MSEPPPVLLLHGQPGSGRDWHRVVAELGTRALVLAPDRPGWDGGAPLDLAGNGRAMLDLLDRHEIPQAVVGGHSLGAAIACWLAIEHPERVCGLVLASPAANLACLEPIDRLLAAPVAGPLLSAALMSSVGLALSAAPLRHLLGDRFGLDAAYLAAAGPGLLRPAAWWAYVVEQRGLIDALPALESGLREISGPCAVVAGSADRIVPLLAAQLLAEQIPGAQLTVIDGADHLLPQRHGSRLARLMLETASTAI